MFTLLIDLPLINSFHWGLLTGITFEVKIIYIEMSLNLYITDTVEWLACWYCRITLHPRLPIMDNDSYSVSLFSFSSTQWLYRWWLYNCYLLYCCDVRVQTKIVCTTICVVRVHTLFMLFLFINAYRCPNFTYLMMFVSFSSKDECY